MGLNRSPPFSPHLIYADSGNFQEGLGYYVLDNLSDKMLAARLSFQKKSPSPRNLDAPAGNWRNGRLS